MSKLYEALKRLEKRHSLKIEERSSYNDQTSIDNKQRYLLFLFIFLVIIFSGAGLIYLVEWHFNKEITQANIELFPKGKIKNKEVFISQNHSFAISSKIDKNNKKNSLLNSHYKETKSKTEKQNRSEILSLTAKKHKIGEKIKSSKKIENLSKVTRKTSISSTHKVDLNRNISKSNKFSQERSRSFHLTNRESKRALLVMAEEARQSRNYQEAIRYYRLYLRDQKDPQVLNNLGALLLLLRQNLEAVKILEEAYQLKKDPDIAFNLVLAYLNSGKTKEACQIMQELHQENSILPSNWQVLFQNTPCNQYLPNSHPSRKE